MIADVAHILLLVLKICILVSGAVIVGLFSSSHWVEYRHKRARRRHVAAVARNLNGALDAVGSKQVIPEDRNHPLYSIGGQRGPDHSLQGRFR